MSTIIVLIVSIKFEELTRKKNSFETVDDKYKKLQFSLVLEIINRILVQRTLCQ